MAVIDFYLSFWYVLLFLLGASVGSLMNVCIYRLPLEKSILWPSSRCFSCLQPIRFYDNIPILSYAILRGRCRVCRQTFSTRYALIELFSGLAWPGLFYLEVQYNWHGLPYFDGYMPHVLFQGIPWKGLWFFLHHALLLSFLIVAAVCDLDGRVIPLSVTVPGTLIGLIGATFHPWPWPWRLGPEAALATLPANVPWADFQMAGRIPLGLYPWPAWEPVDWLPAGSWQLGLVTGLVGAAVGSVLLRGVKLVFEKGLGKEALGLGDADLMMMAGAFLGWQPVVIAFFLGAVAALVLAVPAALAKGENALPFGPGLAVGVVGSWLGWRWIGPKVQYVCFDEVMIILLTVISSIAMFVMSLMFRRRGLPEVEVEGGKPDG
jgi:leader peptidase (prepilin peptidase)/N-methyltransferase